MTAIKVTSTREVLGASALDLKRVSLSYSRGSINTAQRFSEEALKRKAEVVNFEVKPYIRKFLDSLPEVLAQVDKGKLAEDALMYSTIFQNYVLKNG